MAHELEHDTSAIYAGNIPAWHNLGIVVGDDDLTTEQIYAAIPELGSHITASPVLAISGADVVTSDRWVANVRDYDGKIVGVVSPTYQLVQPDELFQFVQDLMDVETDAVWDTAMSLRDGSVTVGCLKLPKEIKIGGVGSETHRPYLMIGNSYDGSMSLTLTISWVRAVCMNTVQWSISSAARRFTLRHTASIEGRMQEAKDALAMTYRYGDVLDQMAREMLKVKLTPAAGAKIITSLFPMPKPKDGEAEVMKLVAERIENKRSDVVGHWQTADNLADVRNTGWGLLNAVTEWEQFLAHPNRKPEKAMERVLDDSVLATRATELILAR